MRIGVKAIYEEHAKLAPEKQYVRHVECVESLGPKPFYIIVCMFPAMSKLLIEAKRPTIDTSFKRAKGY